MKTVQLVLLCALVTLTLRLNGQILACRSIVNVSIDASGNARLSLEDLIVSPRCPTCSYSIIPSPIFNCDDVGDTIRITVTDNSDGVSCYVDVVVQNKLLIDPCASPLVGCISEVNVSLDASGNAALRPEDVIPPGFFDPTLTYRLEPNTFDCTHVGPNRARLYARRGSGPENYCTFTINVVDQRKNPPLCIILIEGAPSFYPADRFQYIVNPGDPINYRSDIRYITTQNTLANLQFYISRDKKLSKDDLLVGGQKITLKKKQTSLSALGKFQMPQIPDGKYFLIMTVVPANKQTEMNQMVNATPFFFSNKRNINELNTRSLEHKEEILIYPNPSTDLIYFQLPEDNHHINIYDVMGKRVREIENCSGNTAVDISQLVPGLYFGEIISDGRVLDRKTIVKQ